MQRAVADEVAIAHAGAELAALAFDAERARQAGRVRRGRVDRARPVFHEKAADALGDRVAAGANLPLDDRDVVAAALQRIRCG